jgi:hypothetical protein
MQPDMVIHGGPRQSGIYHLLCDGEVQYIGQSVHVLQRVAAHCAVPCDEVHVYFCPESELNDRERADIERLRLRLNVAGIDRPYICAARVERAICVNGDYYTSAQEYLRGLPNVMRRDLRAIGLMKCADDLALLFAQGFPEPAAQRGRMLFWSTDAVLNWIDVHRSHEAA